MHAHPQELCIEHQYMTVQVSTQRDGTWRLIPGCNTMYTGGRAEDKAEEARRRVPQQLGHEGH